jgi:chorismate-pyruvate lyase
MVTVEDPSGLRAALESTNGTVTDFLEQLVGEGIDAAAHSHRMIAARLPNDLEAAPGEPLLQRAATLRGRGSGSPYVYAESVIVRDRLPTRFLLRLESSTDPIGRILQETGIAITRKSLFEPLGFDSCRLNRGVNVVPYLFARTYRIDSQQVPLMIVTEWFLEALRPFLLA